MRRRTALFIAASVLVLCAEQRSAGQSQPVLPAPDAPIVFVNVNLVPMDKEGVEPEQTVIVRGDRIVASGASRDVPVPQGARVIDGSGRYLVPGLTDAHVHLIGDGTGLGTSRADFGDAPLYLAYGVTTVFNLSGTPAQLEWRRRVESGELVGPTIYTSGDFVNEPRVNTPEEVEREIRSQARDGYDLIKFHEVFAPGVGNITTRGLSRATYLKMIDVAREIGIPLVGHAPVNLGLDVLLQARQPLAHVGMLSNIYFLPLISHRAWLLLTASAFAMLIMLAVTTGGVALVRRWRSGRGPATAISRLRVLVALQVLAGVLAALSAGLFLPGGPLFASTTLRVIFSGLIVFMAAATVSVTVSSAAMLRTRGNSPVARVESALASIASLVFLCAALFFWLPIAWRSSAWGVERFANRIHDAGIPVMTTLVNYDSIGGPGRLRLVNDPVIDYLREDTRRRWQFIARRAGPPGYRYTEFMKSVTVSLHRAGVPLMAGTDAMGAPLVAPGSSLHRELELLTESGLTPYEAIHAATVAPASFLRKEEEFGTIAPGKRADLLLVAGNPLDNVAYLKEPIGVMTRGRWFPREQLQQMLSGAKSREP